MLTPLEIDRKEFQTSIAGYNKDEVDNFLYDVSNYVDQLIDEQNKLEAKVAELEDELEKFNSIEKNLTDALVLAKNTSDDVIDNAKQRADNIVQEAENQARKIINEADNDVYEAHKKYDELKKEFTIYKSKIKSILESQTEIIESINID
jgi:cell division initiation protein